MPFRKDADYLTREIWEDENRNYEERLARGELSLQEKRPHDWTEEDVQAAVELTRKTLGGHLCSALPKALRRLISHGPTVCRRRPSAGWQLLALSSKARSLEARSRIMTPRHTTPSMTALSLMHG